MPPKKTPYKPDPDIEKKYPHLKEFFPFLHDLRFESDRGAVLLCCAYLDDLLRDVLASFLVNGEEATRLLEGFNAPLGTFSARITAAYAMALITDHEFKELTTLRKVRNEFAHSKTAAFSDQKIADLCANLAYSVPDTKGKPEVSPALRFNSAAVGLINSLGNRAFYAERERRQPKAWPR
jgi:mannitol operon repressor